MIQIMVKTHRRHQSGRHARSDGSQERSGGPSTRTGEKERQFGWASSQSEVLCACGRRQVDAEHRSRQVSLILPADLGPLRPHSRERLLGWDRADEPFRLPKDPVEMESAVRRWLFGDKAPTAAHASVASPMKPAASASARGIPIINLPDPSTDSLASDVSNLRIATPRENTSPLARVHQISDIPLLAAVKTAPGAPAPGPKFDHPK